LEFGVYLKALVYLGQLGPHIIGVSGRLLCPLFCLLDLGLENLLFRVQG
jgi:hypothetical protein